MRPARKEATGWRDQALSARHCDWGADLAALDLDLLLVEFDHGKPCGLIEFKRNTVDVDLQHPSMRALAKLADGCAIPFIVARYQVELWCFEALPGNAIAHRLFRRGWLTEAELVGHLYKLRGRLSHRTCGLGCVMSCCRSKPLAPRPTSQRSARGTPARCDMMP
jgi:hypothetical protein